MAAVFGGGIKHVAQLEGPEAVAPGLQVALGGLEQLVDEAVAQVAVIRQKGIGQGHALGGIRSGTLRLRGAERQAAGLL